MEAAIQSHDPDRLLLTLLRHDGLATHRTARRVLPARERGREGGRNKKERLCLCVGNAAVPVEVFYAVDLGGGVHGEGDAVQTAVADHAGEAAGVVGLPHRSQDPVQDGLGAL